MLITYLVFFSVANEITTFEESVDGNDPPFVQYFPEEYAEDDGYVEDVSEEIMEQLPTAGNASAITFPYPTLPFTDDLDNLSYMELSTLLNETELSLLRLKSQESLSTRVMNKIFHLLPKLDLGDVPARFEQISETVETSNPAVSSVEIEYCSTTKNHVEKGHRTVFFIPLHRWLHIFVQLNLTSALITAASNTPYYGDISTGSWFPEFLARVPANHTPIAIDVYYDHWGVSKSGKIGGLYIAIANLPSDMLMRPDNKFVCCLVPCGILIHRVLLHVLGDLIKTGGTFKIQIGNATFYFYVEIARLVGDIPGLAELCGLLNHRANSPCRKCKCNRDDLQDYSRSHEPKTQALLLDVWLHNLPKLQLHGHKGHAKLAFQSLGMSALWPVWLNLPAGQKFDICKHSVACLMHNEELGLLLQEIEHFWKLFESSATQHRIIKRMKKLPDIPGLPKFKGSFFLHTDRLLAKEVISISKRILHATYKSCHTDHPEFIEHWECLQLHIKYLNMLAQPSIHKSFLTTIHSFVLSHNIQYKHLYLPAKSFILNPHVGLHWKDDIPVWGLPIYYSTMHWEPKHKLLKIIKSRQTNNSDHNRDVLLLEYQKQLEKTTSWDKFSFQLPTFKPSTFSAPNIQYCKSTKATQLKFRSSLLENPDRNLCSILGIRLPNDIDDLHQLKFIVINTVKYVLSDTIMVWGNNDDYYFGKIQSIFAWIIKGMFYPSHIISPTLLFVCFSYKPISSPIERVMNICVKLQWLETEPTPILRTSCDRFTQIPAKYLLSTDYCDVSAIECKVAVLDSYLPDNNYLPYVIDSCYYINKYYAIDDDVK